MARIIEAEARITARDMTGATFDHVASKIRHITRAAQQVGATSAVLTSMGRHVEKAGEVMARTGRRMTLGVTLPTVMAARSAGHVIHNYALAANKLKAFGDLNEAEVKRAKALAQQYGSQYAFGPVGVLQGTVEEIKAGFKPEQLAAIQQPLLDFATLAEIDLPRAAELAMTSLAGFDKTVDKTGKLLSGAQLSKNLREMVDLFAILNKVAPGSIGEIADTFKYTAPGAAKLGISPVQLGAFTTVLAQAGIVGQRAGIALRGMMVRFIRPSPRALASLSAAGLNIGDYVKTNPALLKPEAILSAVENVVGTAPPAARARFLKSLAGLQGLSGEDYAKGLTGVLRSAGGGLKDADQAAKLAQRIIGTAVEKIDVRKFFEDVFSKSPNPAALLAQFMPQRFALTLANLNAVKTARMLADIEKELADARERQTSVSREQAATINSGLVEAENKLRGAWQNLIVSLGDSGVVDSATKFMNALASGARSLAQVNPKALEYGTYAILGLAALGPVLLALGNLLKIAGPILRATGKGAALGRGLGAGGMGLGTGLAVLETMKKDAETGHHLRSGLRSLFGLPDPKEPAPWQPGGAWDHVSAIDDAALHPKHWTVDDIRRRLGGGGAPALSGHADLSTTIKVEPSPDFLTRIEQTISNAISGLHINNTPPQGTSGSTGPAMQEAGPSAP
jgi:TP901 family phage tail tape measure protein